MPADKRAHTAVRLAVLSGDLPPVSGLRCVDCGRRAASYHHESYEPGLWLQVTPLCSACHRRRHAKPPKAVVQTTVRIDPEVYAAAQRDAAAAGVSLNEWIVRAMREKAERARG